MNRSGAVLALACLAICRPMRAERVASARAVMTPPIPRTCRAFDGWDKVEKCLARFGHAAVARELPNAKLVAITSTEGYRVPGLYLYRQKGKQWVIAGMYETNGGFEVFDLAQPTIEKHVGFRFDIGIVQDTSETDTMPAGVMRARLSVFCPGSSYFCIDVMTSCEVLVEGRARETFRGKLSFKGTSAVVTGDRSRAGAQCSAPEETALLFEERSRDVRELDPFM